MSQGVCVYFGLSREKTNQDVTMRIGRTIRGAGWRQKKGGSFWCGCSFDFSTQTGSPRSGLVIRGQPGPYLKQDIHGSGYHPP